MGWNGLRSRLTPRFSANRMVREYTENYYLPAASAFLLRCRQGAALAAQLASWSEELDRHWGALRFGTMNVHSTADQHRFEIPIYLDDLAPENVRVELCAEALEADGQPELHVMHREAPLTGAVNGYLYTASVTATRPSDHYTPRIVPYHEQASVPLDAVHILWQR